MSTTPKTRVDVIDQVLYNLGVLVEGQTPSADTRAKVDRVLDGHMASLSAADIVYVADLGTPNPLSGGEFDIALWLPIADTLAFRAASQFNLAGDPSLKALDILARDELRILTRPPRSRRMLRLDPAVRGNRLRVGSGSFTKGT